jgi:hypothetical protein
MFNKKGQGTIEYLLIIAVVIVLALAASYFMFASMGSASQADKASLKAAWQSKEVGIADFAVSSDGSGKIALMNNSGEIVTIKKVYVNDVLVYDSSFSIGNFDKYVIGSFSSNVTPCNSELRYNIKIIYESESGLEDQASGDLYAECMGAVTQVNTLLLSVPNIDSNINMDLNITTGLLGLANSQAVNSRNLDDISQGSSPDSNVKYDTNVVTLNTV